MGVPVLHHQGTGGKPQTQSHVPEQPLGKVAAPDVRDPAVDGDGEEEGPESGFEVEGGLGVVRGQDARRDDEGFGLLRPLEVERDGHGEAVYGIHVGLHVSQGLEHGYGAGVRGPGHEGGVVTLGTLDVVEGQAPRPRGHGGGAQSWVRVVRGEGVVLGVQGRDRGPAHGGQDGVDGRGISGGGAGDPELEQVVVVEVPYDFGPVGYGVQVTHVLSAEMVPRECVDEWDFQGFLRLGVQVDNLLVALAMSPPRVVISRTFLVANDHHAPPDQLGLTLYGLGRVKDGGHHRPPLARALYLLVFPRGR